MEHNRIQKQTQRRQKIAFQQKSKGNSVKKVYPIQQCAGATGNPHPNDRLQFMPHTRRRVQPQVDYRPGSKS